jgi:hypothetical protein
MSVVRSDAARAREWRNQTPWWEMKTLVDRVWTPKCLQDLQHVLYRDLREEKSLRSCRALTVVQYPFLSIDATNCDCDVGACECCFGREFRFFVRCRTYVGRGRQALATVARSRIMFVGYHDAYIDACVLQACPRSFLRWIAVHL